MKTILAFLDRGTVRNTLVFSWNGRIYKDCKSLSGERALFESLELASRSPWYACRSHSFFFFLLTEDPDALAAMRRIATGRMPKFASNLDALIGNVTNFGILPFFQRKRRTNSSSQPSSQAHVSSAGPSWPPTDKPKPRRSTSVRKQRPAASAPQAAPL